MVLLPLTLGSRNYFLPESHCIQMIAWCTRRFRSYSLMFPRYFEPSFLLFHSVDKPQWITKYTCHSYNHSSLILLLQDTPKFSLMFRKYFVPTALQFFAKWIPLRIISRTSRVSTHPQLIHVCHQSLKYQSFFWKSSAAYCSWNSCLLTLWLIPSV